MDETPQTSENTSLSVLIISGDTGANLAATKLLTSDGHKVASTTQNASEGAAKIRAAGGLPLFIDAQRAGELHGMIRMFNADVVINFGPLAANEVPFAPSNYTAEMLLKSTEALVQAVKGTGVQFIVHTSYAFLYGDTGGETVDESAHLEASGKLASAARHAEQMILKGETPACVLRAGHVYSAHSSTFKHMADSLRVGRPVTASEGYACWISDEQLGQIAVLAALKRPAGKIFNAVDDHPVPQNEFLREFAAAMGVEPAGGMAGLMAMLRGRNEAAGYSVKASNAKAKQELGWQPRFTDRAADFDQVLLTWRAGMLVES